MGPKDLTYRICRCYINDQTDVNSELSSSVLGFLRSRNLEKLTSCSALFQAHSHKLEDWKFLRQVEAFFKKNASFVEEEKCKVAAGISFFESENECRATNLRLQALADEPEKLSKVYRLRIMLARRFIKAVLGDFQSFVSDLPTLIKITPGATSQSARRDSLPQLKMKLKLYASARAQRYVSCLYHFFGFGKFRLLRCESNRIELVPKNWKTHRTIACEPEGNLPLQLAFDTWVKRRLRPFGINLSDQSANQRLAKHASVHNDFVTVDMRRASDTISIETVRWLLPGKWFRYLSDIRSPMYRGTFGDGMYAKFSSMGNGATFTLETLIFAAVCLCLGSTRFLVYGDDVIIEKRFFSRFKVMAKFFGFSINSEKTFCDGPFRESCGGDYFEGVDVTPVYIRNIDSRKAVLCHIVNTLAQISTAGGELEGLLYEIVQQNKLPLVPFVENTMAGVHIDPVVARRKNLLVVKATRKDGPILKHYKAYVPVSVTRSFVDSRGYYLWFLRRNSQVLFAGPWDSMRLKQDELITSSVPIFQHKYVRRWVVWCEANKSMPVHLIWWTEILLAGRKAR